MSCQTQITKPVKTALDIAVEETIRMDVGLWDEASFYYTSQLKKKAEAKQELQGSKFLADVQEHIDKEQEGNVYVVYKRSRSNANQTARAAAFHC